jgi:predicted KAP-like P-loop ATPase
MWADNETARDFVNFSGVAASTAELIVRAQGRPISIGVSGEWGTGKSSMIQLIEQELYKRERKEGPKCFVLVKFNAWLYQGYDDARAALLDVIADTLAKEAEARQTAGDKVLEFAKRVRWLRLAKWIAGGAAAVALGLPPLGLEKIYEVGRKVLGGTTDADTASQVRDGVAEAGATAAGFLAPSADTSPPKEIQALRDNLQATLKELNITLVVLIDDLDRCLPETTISTLEAIRLFLFMDLTAFVIAADTTMIRYAVRRHFEGFEGEAGERLITSYFDKLIQVPIRVPPLGTQEVRAYLHLLFIDNSALSSETKEAVRQAVADQLRQSWQGKRVDAVFVKAAVGESALYPQLIAQLESADRLAPLMVSSTNISGNPRLIKRFLNAVSIRSAIAQAQGVSVDEAVLAKLLLFERLASPETFNALVSSVNEDSQGRPTVLEPMEVRAQDVHDKTEFDGLWGGSAMREWMALAPALAGTDLRGALYVGREHAPLITAEDHLSASAAEMLTGLLSKPELAPSFRAPIKSLPRADLARMMARLLDSARTVGEWGVPPILEACLVVAEADEALGRSLGAFLAQRPATQIKPNLVAKLRGLPWAKSVFDHWLTLEVTPQVKRAINPGASGRGNIGK